jgi:anti-sigma factor ChrR (cupin superfamily)
MDMDRRPRLNVLEAAEVKHWRRTRGGSGEHWRWKEKGKRYTAERKEQEGSPRMACERRAPGERPLAASRETAQIC